MEEDSLFFNSESWTVLIDCNRGFKQPMRDFNRLKMLVLLQCKNAIKLELNITIFWLSGVQDASH
jgi:hypothetical protein